MLWKGSQFSEGANKYYGKSSIKNRNILAMKLQAINLTRNSEDNECFTEEAIYEPGYMDLQSK